MTPTLVVAFIAVGLAVGFLAGLVGIGGGVLMVPFLYFVYEGSGTAWGWVVSPGLAATVSHATSLFVIVPTAIVGTIAYTRSGAVAWRAALPIAAASMVGGVAGARIAVLLPGDLLKSVFGLFLIASAVQLVMVRSSTSERPARQTMWLTLPTGLIVGLFSALMGVGGGLVAIPLLLHVIGLPIQKVAATSLAVIVFAAAAGTVTYVVTGWGTPGLAAHSLGYVHAPAAFPLMVGSVFAVRAGTRVNQRMDVRVLQRIFAVLLFLLGARLVVQGLAGLR